MRYQKPDVIERTDIGFPQGLGGGFKLILRARSLIGLHEASSDWLDEVSLGSIRNSFQIIKYHNL